MRKDLYLDLYQKEGSYWWHVGRRKLAFALLQKYVFDSGVKNPIMDAGCGTGGNMEVLQKFGQVFGVDKEEAALSFCRHRGLGNLYLADITKTLPFSDNFFSLVTGFDMLEHIENDEKALREFHRILRPGGTLFLTTPAHPFLWSKWDEVCGHKRRYQKQELRQKVEAAGFKIRRLSASNFFIFPLSVLVRKLKEGFTQEKSGYTTDFMPVPDFVNKLLISIYGLEEKLIKNFDLPVGLSFIVLAKKEV